MPTPPRRRPAAGPTTRRPRVAGLRKPAVRPEPAEDGTAEVAEAGGTSGPPPPGYRERNGRDHDDSAPVDSGDEDGEGDQNDSADQDGQRRDDRDREGDQRRDEPEPEDDQRQDDGEREGDQGHDGDADDTAQERDDVVDAEIVTDGVITAAPGEGSDQAHENDEGSPKRPSPSGKRRAGSRVAPSSLSKAEWVAKGPTSAKVVLEPGRRAVNLAIGLAVAALLCAALGLFFKGQADRLTSGADRGNSAFTDPAGTAEVKTQIIAALERALSYDYRDLDKTAAAVREVLSGRAVCEYEAMFGQLKELAPAQKLVHTTIVRELGVRSLNGDRAEALVFIDQTSTRVEKNQTTASGAQLGVTAERVDGQWKITAFDTFNQPLPNGQALPQC